MEKFEVLLDSYALQKDLRIRLPKQILANMPVDVGSVFNIYYNPSNGDIVLRLANEKKQTITDNDYECNYDEHL